MNTFTVVIIIAAVVAFAGYLAVSLASSF